MLSISRLSRVIRQLSTHVSKNTPPSAPVDPLKNVVGLTANCVKPNEAKNVPGTGKEYQVPEYFGYKRTSYHEAEVEMEKFRVPQPVAPRK